MKPNKRVLIIAGGTGGHIFPALAAARALRKEGFDLQWLGSRVGMESDLVRDEFPMHFVSVKAIRGKSLFSKFTSLMQLSLAGWQAWKIIRKVKPDVVLGMGGFVSGPGGVATRLTRTPLVIHEQNAVAGLTNRLLSKHAQAVLQGFPNAFPKTVVAKTIGNPVRQVINALALPEVRFQNRSGPLRVLVVGGSQGARAINQSMTRVLRQYPDDQTLEIWHQTGRLDFETVQQEYKEINVQAKVQAFIDDMSEAYAWADLVICRAGALTVSELAAAGLPSILIPFPYAVDDHQFYNGSYLSDVGAAELIRQNELTDDRLRERLQYYASHRSALLDMAIKAKSLAKPEALSVIVDVCERLSNGK